MSNWYSKDPDYLKQQLEIMQIISCAQDFLCKVQAKVERCMKSNAPRDWTGMIGQLEEEIPPTLLSPNTKCFFDIRKELARLKGAKDSDRAWEKLEIFYQNIETALDVLETKY